MSPGAQVRPSTPSRTASASAPAVVVTTGTPCAKASRAFCEAVASRYGMTSASAAATASQNALLAFAHGVPVVTTTAGALAEAVRDGVDGLTCAPGDTGDLLRVLTEISDPVVLGRLRAGVRTVDPEPGWAAYLRVLLAG